MLSVETREVSRPARLAGARLARHSVWAILVLGIAIALLVGLYRASAHSFGANSDGATVVLEGAAIGHGHLTLSGWDLSYDSFWSIDALVYALGAVVLGLRHQLLHLVPALIALAGVALGAWLARDRARGLAAVLPVVLVVGLLGLPNPILAFFLLQGPWHVGTALWCLVAFVGLRRARFDFGWVIAVVFLALGLLGDMQTLVLGCVPAAVAGLVTMVRARRLRAGLPLLAAPLGAAGLAVLIRWAAVRIGTFAIAKGYTKAHAPQYPINVKHIVSWSAGLLGVGNVPIGPTPALAANEMTAGPFAEQFVRGIGLVLIALGVLAAVVGILRAVVRGSGPDDPVSPDLLDTLLLGGMLGSWALFVYLCPNGNGDYARYLTAGVVFGVLLGARTIGRLLQNAGRPQLIRGVAVGAGLFLAAAAIDFVVDLGPADAPQPAVSLGRFLEQHGFREGLGDYWSASLVTVVTDGKVAVRPVIPNHSGTLMRYGRQSSARWYEGQHFQFLVFDTARPWRRVDATSATATFGPPTRQYSVGTYRVLTWSKSLAVSPVGFTNG